MQIKFKAESGNIVDFDIAELLEIDGRPFNPAGVSPELQQHLAFIEGRISTLENALYSQLKTEEGE